MSSLASFVNAFIFFTVVFLQLSIGIASAKKLTPFQKTVQDCLADKIEIKNLTNLKQLYSQIDQKFLLVSSSVLAREVLYKDKEELRKLKFQNGQVSLFKVLEDDNDKLLLLNNEVRQKSLTVESYMSQLLLRADIRSDWLKTQESRSGKTSVTMVQADGEIKTLIIEKLDTSKKLECNRQESSDICSCFELK